MTWFAILVAAFLAAGPGGASRHAANAQSGVDWTVVEVIGDAEIRIGDGAWTKLTPGAAFGARAMIRTARTGRVVLSRGGDRIRISPNSSMALPEADAGAGTTILQTLGTLLFQVETRPERGFVVKTPLLAAAVKGTTFTVTIGEGQAGVHVLEGSVEVGAEASGDVVMLYPGETVTVAAASGSDLWVLGGRRDVPRGPFALRPSYATGSSQGRSDQHRRDGGGRAHRITTSLGGTDLDLTSLTDGLVQDADDVNGGVDSGSDDAEQSDGAGDRIDPGEGDDFGDLDLDNADTVEDGGLPGNRLSKGRSDGK